MIARLLTRLRALGLSDRAGIVAEFVFFVGAAVMLLVLGYDLGHL